MNKDKINDCINIINKLANWKDKLLDITINEIYKELKELEDIYDEIMNLEN